MTTSPASPIYFAFFLSLFSPFCVKAAPSETDVSLGTNENQRGDRPEIDDLFNSVNNPQSPAVSVAVVWDHKPIYVNSFGMADIARGVKADANTAFPLASLTKQFTAYAVLKLAEQKRLSLDAPITKYLPELRYHSVTVRQLMNQTGGVPGIQLARFGNFSAATTADLLNMYKAQDTLIAPAGTRWSYQNSNYFLLDAIVQRVRKITLATYLHDEVFMPLGMARSFFPFGPNATHQNRAYGYGADLYVRRIDGI